MKASGQCAGADASGAIPAITPGETHVAKVRAFLAVYYGQDTGQALSEPMRTLLRAQFGGFASSYDLSLATTKAEKVRLIGNSVCPEVAEALVRANVDTSVRRAA
jgi:DNA (cytosine-5)-methyltransferase 1